ncbi:MAG: hypothetical protein CVT73_02945 [Alphaproteobacteria bacterium HGW-Alphaproteobacteria-12]|nr:MAG: hypothetical protein CVT73_02945 [Alphaproteobacteria bacterium HGW-Alphaproteobacteria-12]
MTSFVFKSLLIAGAFVFFGGHLPLGGDSVAGAMPRLACDADLDTCRLGGTSFAVGARSSLLSTLAVKSRGTPAEDFKSALADPHLASLLDEQVVPDFAVEAARVRLTALVTQLIEGVETGAN